MEEMRPTCVRPAPVSRTASFVGTSPPGTCGFVLESNMVEMGGWLCFLEVVFLRAELQGRVIYDSIPTPDAILMVHPLVVATP